MKASFIIATLALVASVSAQSASDIELGNEWCKVYTDACTKASAASCGPNYVPKNNSCTSVFVNGKCSEYSVACACVTATGEVMTGATSVLETTFAATQGVCSDLEKHSVPISNTLPSATGVSLPSSVTATASGSSPSGTAPPQKGNSAGQTATNAFLAAIAAVGAAALVL